MYQIKGYFTDSEYTYGSDDSISLFSIQRYEIEGMQRISAQNMSSGTYYLFQKQGSVYNLIDRGWYLDTSIVQIDYSDNGGDVYDVTYINNVVGNIETLLEILDIGTGAQEAE